MAVLVGIDEAGFGPLLGPLVVSSCSFSIPSETLKIDLWDVLRKSISDTKKHLLGRLLITDSKKAYSKSTGIKHLERTSLAVLKCLDKQPKTLTELIEVLCPDSLERLDEYPWHKDIHTFDLPYESLERDIAAGAFTKDLDSNGMSLLDVRSCCLDVAHYNKLVEVVKNKSSVLFTAISQLIKIAYENYANQGLHIIVDRQGGRMRYRPSLQKMFPDMDMKILKETETLSSYEMQAGDKLMRLHFVVGADKKYMPVALGSILSKYLRELLVASMNQYFTNFDSNLKPTAGYWQDGLRFIEDLKTNLPHIKYETHQLIRSR